MAIIEKNKVRVEKLFHVPVAKLFKAIGDGKLLFNCSGDCLTFENSFKVGGTYRIVFTGNGFTNAGRYEEIIPNQKISFTWGDTGADPQFPKSLVTIELLPKGDDTQLILTHTGFTNDEDAQNHDGGWTSIVVDFSDELEKNMIDVIRYFDVSVEKLYEVCSQPQFFFAPVADIANGSAEFAVNGAFSYPTAKGEITGKYLEIESGKKIIFSWEKSCATDKNSDSKVTLLFSATDDGSSLELIHEKLASEEAVDSTRLGWATVFSYLLKAPSLQHNEKQ